MMSLDDLNETSVLAVLNALPQGISVHTRDGRVVYANSELLRIYGRESGELVGKSCQEAFHLEGTLCPHGQVLSEKAVVTVASGVRFDTRIYDLVFAPLKTDGGTVNGYLRIMNDVTETRQMMRQLGRAERFSAVGTIMSGVAHDIGTPMNIISGYCEYLLMKVKPTDDGHKELSTILHQTRRVGQFVRQMLELTRPPSGRVDAISLEGFLSETLTLIGHQLRRAGVRASVVCRGRPPLIYADPARLKQAIVSLLINVSQELSSGSSLEIEVSQVVNCSDLVRIGIIGHGVELGAHNFTELLARIMNPQSVSYDEGIGLTLIGEVLRELGAELEISGDPEALVLILPAGAPKAIASGT